MKPAVPANSASSKVATAIAKQTESMSLETMIQKATAELGKALPAGMSPDRIVRIALTCIRQNPELSRCTPASFLGSLFTAASLGLEPVAGRCFLLPFRNRRKVGNEWTSVLEVQLVIGFRGWLELFYRHQAAMSLDVQEVYSNDSLEFEYGTSPFLKHRPSSGDRGHVTHVYAVAKLNGGGTIFRVMTYDECLEHGRRHSKTWDDKTKKFYDSSPWAKEPIAMARKTAILQLAKLLPVSMEVAQAISADETSRDYREGIGSAIDMPITTSWDQQTEPENDSEPIIINPAPVVTGSFQDFPMK